MPARSPRIRPRRCSPSSPSPCWFPRPTPEDAARPIPGAPLAQEFVTVYRSPSPGDTFCYTPGVCRLGDGPRAGRLIVTMDVGGPGAERLAAELDAPVSPNYGTRGNFGQVFASDDGGETWDLKTRFPFFHARPFIAGDSLYVLGRERNAVMAVRSGDGGETWSEPATLTDPAGPKWHQSACNVWRQGGKVYLVMEKTVPRPKGTATFRGGWPVARHAPVLMRADGSADLLDRANWTFASDLVFEDVFAPDAGDDVGVPFWPFDRDRAVTLRPAVDGRKPVRNHPAGWLETNVVSFPDPAHCWHDPDGKTFYLFSRAHTAGTGLCAVSKVTEHTDGSMTTGVVRAPSGRRVLFLPMPGGQMRFHVLYDEPTKLYWLLSSQATDSATRPERLPEGRYGLPNNERHRLQLHWSKNMIDWCFAGMVAYTDSPGQARHYASMAVDGDDLVIASRSGDEKAKSAHDGNLITFHRVRDFRGLVY